MTYRKITISINKITDLSSFSSCGIVAVPFIKCRVKNYSPVNVTGLVRGRKGLENFGDFAGNKHSSVLK